MIYLHCYHLNNSSRDCSKSILLKNLSHYLGKIVTAQDLTKNKNGKPKIKGICFSISHSKNKLIQAFSFEGNLGVDIEYINTKRRVMALAKRYFHRSEFQWLKTLNLEQSASMFYSLWSRKEAVCKAQGGRLWYYLQDNYLNEKQQMTSSIKGLKLIQLHAIPDFSLVVAIDGSDDRVEVIYE